MNAPNNASDTSPALPIAKPFPIAAVVFPAASNASVRSRTSGAKLHHEIIYANVDRATSLNNTYLLNVPCHLSDTSSIIGNRPCIFNSGVT